MARPFDMVCNIIDQKELWKLTIKIHHKWKVSMTNMEHFEIVVLDKQVSFNVLTPLIVFYYVMCYMCYTQIIIMIHDLYGIV